MTKLAGLQLQGYNWSKGHWNDSPAPVAACHSILGQAPEPQIASDEQVGAWHGSLCHQSMNVSVNVTSAIKHFETGKKGYTNSSPFSVH